MEFIKSLRLLDIALNLTLLLLLLCASFHVSEAIPVYMDDTQCMNYLNNYGYLKSNHQNTRQALMDFQRFAGLSQTGYLDTFSRYVMGQPRCGNADRVSRGSRTKRYVHGINRGAGWKKRFITHKVKYFESNIIDQTTFENQLQAAFQVWTEVTGFAFFKVQGNNDADINVVVGTYTHNASVFASVFGSDPPFDGIGGVLAHAFFPDGTDDIRGDIHVDGEELFTVNQYYGTNLFQVLVHEIGHSLGLDHSDNLQSIMAPIYKGYTPNFKLHDDDIRGIQDLYAGLLFPINPETTESPTDTEFPPITPSPPTPGTPSPPTPFPSTPPLPPLPPLPTHPPAVTPSRATRVVPTWQPRTPPRVVPTWQSRTDPPVVPSWQPETPSSPVFVPPTSPPYIFPSEEDCFNGAFDAVVVLRSSYRILTYAFKGDMYALVENSRVVNTYPKRLPCRNIDGVDVALPDPQFGGSILLLWRGSVYRLEVCQDLTLGTQGQCQNSGRAGQGQSQGSGTVGPGQGQSQDNGRHGQNQGQESRGRGQDQGQNQGAHGSHGRDRGQGQRQDSHGGDQGQSRGQGQGQRQGQGQDQDQDQRQGQGQRQGRGQDSGRRRSRRSNHVCQNVQVIFDGLPRYQKAEISAIFEWYPNGYMVIRGTTFHVFSYVQYYGSTYRFRRPSTFTTNIGRLEYLSIPFQSGVDGGVRGVNGRTYIFKGQQYYQLRQTVFNSRYQASYVEYGYPRRILYDWLYPDCNRRT